MKPIKEFSSSGIAAVYDDYVQRWYYINVYGRNIIEPFVVKHEPDKFSDGLTRYVDSWKGKIGFINERAEIVLQATYDHALPFSEGLAAVCTKYKRRIEKNNEWEILDGGHWGYIDKTGKLVIDSKYKKANPFRNGVAEVVTQDDNTIYIDKKGNEIKETNAKNINK